MRWELPSPLPQPLRTKPELTPGHPHGILKPPPNSEATNLKYTRLAVLPSRCATTLTERPPNEPSGAPDLDGSRPTAATGS